MINLPTSGPYIGLTSEVNSLYSLELSNPYWIASTFNANIALFRNLVSGTTFWLNDEYAPSPSMSWYTTTVSGDTSSPKNWMINGWAVRKGDVVSTVSTPAVPPAITTTALPAATVGASYTANISVTVPVGDSATMTVTGLPSGLNYDAAAKAITGAATVIGNFNVNITVADSTTGLSTSKVLPLTVNDNALVFSPANLPDATTNTGYTATFTLATGGYGNITYTATGLPAGLSISGNTISGTPSVAGLSTITLTATDSVGSALSANVTLNTVDPVVSVVPCSGSNAAITAYVPRSPGYITVNGGLNLLDHLWTNNLNPGNTTFNGGLLNWYSTGSIVSWTGTVDPSGCILDHLTVSPRVTVSTTALVSGVEGTAYTAPVTVAWGVAPYTTTVNGLPAGLRFDGVNITGTPTVAGSFAITINATDALGVSAASAALTLTVTAPATSFAPVLPAATVGTAYSATVTATGYGPFSYTASGLPAGLSLSGNIISGTPTAAVSSVLTLTATDAAGVVSSAVATLVVNPNPADAAASSCTAPKGAQKDLNSQGAITAINGNVVTFVTKKGASVSVNVPSCARIEWGNEGSKAFAVGQKFEWHGYSSTATGNVAQSVSIN